MLLQTEYNEVVVYNEVETVLFITVDGWWEKWQVQEN